MKKENRMKETEVVVGFRLTEEDVRKLQSDEGGFVIVQPQLLYAPAEPPRKTWRAWLWRACLRIAANVVWGVAWGCWVVYAVIVLWRAFK